MHLCSSGKPGSGAGGTVETGKVGKDRERQECGLWATPEGISRESFQKLKGRKKFAKKLSERKMLGRRTAAAKAMGLDLLWRIYLFFSVCLLYRAGYGPGDVGIELGRDPGGLWHGLFNVRPLKAGVKSTDRL